MTFEQLWHRWQLVNADFDRAAWAHYTGAYINEAAKQSPVVIERLNHNARFWNYQIDSLQCSFFMALGRLFDPSSDALTMAKLLNLFGQQCDTLLSRAALAKRKRQAGLSHDAVAEYMAGVTADPRKVLKRLRKYLAPARELYNVKYLDVRNKVFGHAVAHHTFQTDILYSQTNFIEVDQLLYEIHEVLAGLFQLMHDGDERTLGTEPPLFPSQIKRETYKLLGFKPPVRKRRKLNR